MKVRKIPMRTCVVTNEKLEKKDLLRIVKTTNGEIKPDLTGKINGRGAYIKKDLEVLEKAKKTKILERRLDSFIGEEIYEEIKRVINNN